MCESLLYRTDRIRLVDVVEADLEPLRDWYLEGRPERLTSYPVGEQSIDAVRERFIRRQRNTGLRVYSIRLCEGDDLIGRVSYFNGNRRSRWVEFGILIRASLQGLGYGSEASELLLHLFEACTFNKVMAQTAEFNRGAIGLLERLGFRLDGRFRQHHELDGILHDSRYYSLLRSEFAPKSSFIRLEESI
jgi:ribosomal-protein-alanine N-acetyltransferase